MGQPHSCKLGMLLAPPMILSYLSRVKEKMDKGLILREISRWMINGETTNGFISVNLLCLMLSLNDFLLGNNGVSTTCKLQL